MRQVNRKKPVRYPCPSCGRPVIKGFGYCTTCMTRKYRAEHKINREITDEQWVQMICDQVEEEVERVNSREEYL